MLKVLHSKVCHKKNKACAKALKKVCSKKTKKHGKHKKKHGKHKKKKSDVPAAVAVAISGTAAVAAPQALGLPYTPNPAPSGFTSYHSQVATAVNRNDLLSLQKEFKNGLTEIRSLYKNKSNPWAMDEPTATGKPPGTRSESALGGAKGSGSLRNDPDNTHFESGNLGPD